VANKHLVTLKDFSSSTRSIFASSWVALPWQLISWGFRQVGLGGASDDRLSKERLVIVANVQVNIPS
jgi:charged multivesicular body protein 7